MRVSVVLLVLALSSFHGRADGNLNIGFFGGTFDPPHAGHRDVILSAIKQFHLDKVMVMVGDAPHKPGASPRPDRVEMAKMAFEDIPNVHVVSEASDGAKARLSNPDFVMDLTRTQPNATIYSLEGSDVLERVQSGEYAPLKARNLVHVVNSRDGDPLPAVSELRTEQAYTQIKGVSSTKIRSAIAGGKKPTEIGQNVYDYIVRKHLFNNKLPMSSMSCGALFEMTVAP